jgi:hypothetical protein
MWKRLRHVGCSVLLAGARLHGASPADGPALLDAGYRQMYNLDFDAAHKTFDEWMRAHPADPVGRASDAAAYLFAEFDRVHILQSEFFTDDASFRAARRFLPNPATRQAPALADALKAADLRKYQSAYDGIRRGPALMAELLLMLDRRGSLRRRVFSLFSARPEMFSSLLALHAGAGSLHALASAVLALGWGMLTF